MNHLANANIFVTVHPVERPFSEVELDRVAEAPIITPEPVVLGVTDITGHAHTTLKRNICATIECHSCPYYKERGSC